MFDEELFVSHIRPLLMEVAAGFEPARELLRSSSLFSRQISTPIRATVVQVEGVEPTSLAATVSKTAVSAIFTTPAYKAQTP